MREKCVRVQLRDRIVEKHVLHFPRVHVIRHELRHRLQILPAAIRAVVVGDLDEGDLGGRVPLRGRVGDVDGLVGERFFLLSLPAHETLQQRLDRVEVPLHHHLLRLQPLDFALERGDLVSLALRRRQRQQRDQRHASESEKH